MTFTNRAMILPMGGYYAVCHKETGAVVVISSRLKEAAQSKGADLTDDDRSHLEALREADLLEGALG